jgi:hypothetical protein
MARVYKRIDVSRSRSSSDSSWRTKFTIARVESKAWCRGSDRDDDERTSWRSEISLSISSIEAAKSSRNTLSVRRPISLRLMHGV